MGVLDVVGRGGRRPGRLASEAESLTVRKTQGLKVSRSLGLFDGLLASKLCLPGFDSGPRGLQLLACDFINHQEEVGDIGGLSGPPSEVFLYWLHMRPLEGSKVNFVTVVQHSRVLPLSIIVGSRTLEPQKRFRKMGWKIGDGG